MTTTDPLAAWDAAEDVGVVAATGRYTSPAYWFQACNSPDYVGEPEERCTSCGKEVAR
jgi:hypothetical protein